MNLSVTRDSVRINEPIFDSVADHPVDCDIILPDYCPDIARIMKTEACSCVDSRSIDGNRLTVNGTFSVKVIYIPEGMRNVRCVSHEAPFSHSFDLREIGDRAYSRAKARVVFANCRPLGPRRLQIRGSVAISAKVWCEREESFISGSDDERLEILRKPLSACVFVGAADRPFDVEEELEIGYGKPAAASIIKSDAAAVVQDYKLISNKIIAKGEVMLKTLYAVETEDGEGGQLEVMEHSIPISQIVDIDGVDDECKCEINFTPGLVKIEIKPDSDGENRMFAVKLPVTASARVYRAQDFYAVTDAYSPQYETQLKTKNISFENITDIIKQNEMIRQTVEVGDTQINSITDSSVTANVAGAKLENGWLEITGDMDISLIAVDSQGGPACIDKSMPYTIRTEIKGATAGMRCDPDVRVISAGYSLSGPDRIDMRIECSVEGIVYGVSNENTVAELEMDDSQPKACAASKTLTLYFADSGEKIWDIAKRYNTSPEAIKRENNLDSDMLDDRSMLLIPKKRCSKT